MESSKAKKAVLYVRVSTQHQVDKDSLPMQKQDLTSYCKYVLGINDFVILEDAGYSAKNTDRPAFQEMMSRIRTGEFTHILVWKIDRISRNLLDFASMYAELKELGITFISKNEQFDTSSAIGEAMLKIILVFAELERNMVSERVSAVMLDRAKNGAWNGGRSPTGYRIENGKYVIHEEEAAIVRMLFDECEHGKSLIQLAKVINGMGVKPRYGKVWHESAIRKILTNKTYYGALEYSTKKGGEVLIENHHQPLITYEQYEKCRSIMSSRSRKKGFAAKSYTRKHTHIFSGLVTCGYCGGHLVAQLDKARREGDYRPSYYICTGRRNLKICKNKLVPDMIIGQFVLRYLSNLLRAYRHFNENTTLEDVRQTILSGLEAFGVIGISENGLSETFNAYLNSDGTQNAFTYRPKLELGGDQNSEASALVNTISKESRALERLTQLYLYSESPISESEYSKERKELEKRIYDAKVRLERIQVAEVQCNKLKDEWRTQASYLILTKELMDEQQTDFSLLLRALDKQVLKDFVQATIQNIVIKDRRIEQITLISGITHEFVYCNETKKEG